MPNLGQLQVIQKAKEDLEKRITNGTQLDKNNMQQQLSEEVALVDFGLGWALYFTLQGEPYVDRQGQKIPAKKGLPIKYGDTIRHEGGVRSWSIGYNYPWG